MTTSTESTSGYRTTEDTEEGMSSSFVELIETVISSLEQDESAMVHYLGAGT